MKLNYVDQLIEKMEKASLSEVTYKDKEVEIKLKKETPQIVQAPATVTAPVQNENRPVETPAASSTPTTDGKVITAPMVGTFYKAPSPEADPFVAVGDHVNNDTVVCILEAMKLFNEIQAEVTGEIVEILIEDGEMVEYNQPMFIVK